MLDYFIQPKINRVFDKWGRVCHKFPAGQKTWNLITKGTYSHNQKSKNIRALMDETVLRMYEKDGEIIHLSKKETKVLAKKFYNLFHEGL